MPKSIYLVNPKTDAPGYYNSNWNTDQKNPPTTIADLSITTVAAMVPDEFEIELVDQLVSPVNFDHPADFIGITGKSSQYTHMVKIARQFRERGKTIIIGGPVASLDPDKVRPHCDILVQGEMEEIAGDLFADLSSGKWKDHYHGTRPDLSTSPIPRWDLYPNGRAMIGALQTSRGCPYECEFCDVIQYLGRQQRHKSVAQVLAELDVLYGFGYPQVLLSDDNFTVHQRRAKELLAALSEWNDRQPDGHISFSTQLSIDAAHDEEMLLMCREAGLADVYVGIETPNEASLKETKKRQNVGFDLVEKLQRFVDHGIMVIGGMIVGFDNDGPDIFERQYEFAMQTSVPIYTLGLLVATPPTPLYFRLKDAGRLVEDENDRGFDSPWRTNIIPKQMSDEEMQAGLRWLTSNLYAPSAFGKRLVNFINSHGRALDPKLAEEPPKRQLREVDMETSGMVRRFVRLGKEESKVWGEVGRAVANNPAVSTTSVMMALERYMQIRHMYDVGNLWAPDLVGAAPSAAVHYPAGVQASG